MPTLNVTIAANDGAGTSYTLKINQVQHNIDRSVVVAPLPGNSGTGEIRYILIDLGMMMETLVLTGTLASGDTNPTKANLETAARTWWKDADFGAQTGLVQLAIIEPFGTETFYGEIQGLHFVEQGGTVGVQNYSLTFRAVKPTT